MSQPLLALACATLIGCSHTGIGQSPTPRKSQTVIHFKKANPCPANGQPRGPCPGYIVDHIQPLCAGGPDTIANMQWQTAREASIKDVHERATCRALRRKNEQ